MADMNKVAVIIPAAGKGERFGVGENKTLAKLDGRPIFLRTLELFINRDDVIQTILVVSGKDLDEVKSKYGPNLGFMGVHLIEGGTERIDSVAAALTQVKPEAELVAVHDAVRPCVARGMIDAVFMEAAKSGAAILACPVTATLKRVSESGVIDETVPREGLWEAQTPQVFQRELLLKLYAGREQAQGPVTDDARLAELSGQPVAVVKSDATNIKITTGGDMSLAQAILKARPPEKAATRMGAFEEAQW
jgi:2-C-methyl-D-erythritol 4-phosphate cytidylyltransferase